LKSLLLPEYFPKFERLLERTKTKGHYRCELVTSRKDGGKIVNEVVATEVEYKGLKQLLLSFHDITERKEAEEKERIHQQQLIQADKMASLGILVSGVAHEINNPNNFIMVNAPIVAKICKTVEPILEEHYRAHGDFYLAPRIRFSEMKENIPGIISGILEGSQRIDHFVKELKNFSRPTPATMEPGIDINKVIQAAITLLANLIKDSTSRFQTRLDETIPKIKGNFHRLEQVVINLIENSCQALDEKDQAIFVATRFDPALQKVIIRVTDEGAGMSADTMDKIKNPFFSTKRDSGGTGLGLSISSKIVADHKGSLVFESTPGKGATASVLLPVDPGAAPPNPAE
jgi:polar amino acid transport system substrate-binding protein